MSPGPAGTAASAARVAAAQERFRATVGTLGEAGLSEPSALPGWTRGHVCAHLARNADGLRNLLSWAETGTPRPMYAGADSRAADIERDAPRPAAVHLADLERSGEEFLAHARRLEPVAWSAEVVLRNGDRVPAHRLLGHRLREVLIHHVDLRAGFTPADWPAEDARLLLESLAGDWSRRSDCPPLELHAEDTGDRFTAGAGAGTSVRVTGAAHELAAWLAGRSGGRGPRCSSGPLPVLPAWL
ncbi:maleylpyruvate isomerase family mycothiol-dependent enzyme [Streptomyces sp. HB2AG]|uniref:maleylpyruvate isomerase family mycothiol-dependent enzyme n=1 Tax=Streptomyces sp. HB2AG TaxID=2983400 RepID=UPI0022AB1F9D|nr:maleylpyruvate isomerase family mycothiol-dependent enzyme [Streptomyces sp. HB2AG]MCZ2523228.1 maleylpyruvate isomerase family mycothiol-dependent enzyme [Streptomyces sp. HB2AG]